MIAAPLLGKLIEKIALYDDAIAYKELFLLYHKRLVQFSMTITHSKESAEEVVSDVFLKLWTTRATLTRVENFHFYIYVITKNFSINRFLKEKREQSFSLDEVIVDSKSFYADPEQLLITSEMSKKIQKAVESLPPKCQLIFKLIKEDGLKYKEVAELLHLSVKTIENQMAISFKRIGESIRLDLSKTSLN